MASANELVKQELVKYCKNEKWLKNKKANVDYANAVEQISEADITYGTQPIMAWGYVNANATAEGERYLNEVKSTRTISLDFTTKEALFKRNYCVQKTMEKAQKLGLCGTYYEYSSDLAEPEGKKLCRQNLSDLNYSMKSYRLNRSNVVYTSNDIKIPIWPIYANIKYKNKSKEEMIGYYYERNGQVYIDLDIYVPMTSLKKAILWLCIIVSIIIVLALI